MDAKALILFVVIVSIALVIFGNLIGQLSNYLVVGGGTDNVTANVTGLGRVMLDLIVPILILVVILIIINYVRFKKK